MRKAIGVLLVLASAMVATQAWGSCPSGTRYDCYTTANGKQSCGCR